MLIQNFGLFIPDILHLRISLCLGRLLALSFIFHLIFLPEMAHQYTHDDRNVIGVVVSDNRSVIDPEDKLLQFLIASLHEENDQRLYE